MTMRNRDAPAYNATVLKRSGATSKTPESQRYESHHGLTKREAAAIAAMQGMLALGWRSKEQRDTARDKWVVPDDIAQGAVAYADALFDELEKPRGDGD